MATLGTVPAALALLAALLLPTAVGWAAVLTVRGARSWSARQRDRVPVPLGPPIERVATDLRRLDRQRHELRREGPSPGRAVRIRALEAAYRDLLLVACRRLEVDPPASTPSGQPAPGEVARVEDELCDRGLDVFRSWTPRRDERPGEPG